MKKIIDAIRNHIRKTKSFLLIGNVLSVLLVLLSCFAFSSTQLVRRDVVCSELSALAKRSDYQSIFCEAKFADDQPNGTETVFRKNSVLLDQIANAPVEFNFSPYFVSSDFNKNIVSFNGRFGKAETGHNVAAVTYERFMNGDHFEMSDIYLYDTKNTYFSPTETTGEEGFIPDYIADEIVENTPSYSTYDDLLLDNCMFSLTSDNFGTVFSFRIVNIFESEGFKYVSSSFVNEGNSKLAAQSARKSIGDFVVVINNKLFGGDNKYSCFVCYNTSFMHDNIRHGLQAALENYYPGEINVEASTVIDNEAVSYDKCNEFPELFSSGYSSLRGANIYITIADALILLAYSLFLVFSYPVGPHLYLFGIMGLLLGELVFEILFAIFSSRFSARVLSFFNIFGGGAFVFAVCFGFFIPLILIFINRHRTRCKISI